MCMQPPPARELTRLLCSNRPVSIVDRDGQQIGVLTRNWVKLAPSSAIKRWTEGIARIDPSMRSWSSVVMKSTFFCVPGRAGGGGGRGGGGEGTGGRGMIPLTLVLGLFVFRCVDTW